MLHKSPKICLACSAGGHLRELQLAIGAIPEQWDCYWLTLKTTSTKAFMADKEHVFLVNFQPAKKWTLIVNCLQVIFCLSGRYHRCRKLTGNLSHPYGIRIYPYFTLATKTLFCRNSCRPFWKRKCSLGTECNFRNGHTFTK